MVHRAYILSNDNVMLEELMAPQSAAKPILMNGMLNFLVGTPLAEAQREIILATLQHFSGNKRLTAATLGISLKTLYNRLKEY